MTMDGILVIDKPQGPTSHDVVDAVRRALRLKKVGHTGTLDPMATGVLPLVLGNATKLARYVAGGHKLYCATVQLGSTTSTLDAEGEICQTRPVECDLAQVQSALAAFCGTLEQVPPMYSAKKVGGKKLYTLARQGVEVERQAKVVTIFSLKLLAYEATTASIHFEVNCTAGTYVRVLAQDIGEKLACGGHLKALRRLQAGPFALHEALPLKQVIDAPHAVQPHVLPLRRALANLPTLQVPQRLARLLSRGYQLNVADLRTLDTPDFSNDQALAVLQDGGRLIAIARTQLSSVELSGARRDRQALKTERVLGACNAGA